TSRCSVEMFGCRRPLGGRAGVPDPGDSPNPQGLIKVSTEQPTNSSGSGDPSAFSYCVISAVTSTANVRPPPRRLKSGGVAAPFGSYSHLVDSTPHRPPAGFDSGLSDFRVCCCRSVHQRQHEVNEPQ